MHRLRHKAKAKAKAGRLLRVLFLRLAAVPAGSGRALGREWCGVLLRGVITVSTDTDASTRDWLRSPRTSLLAWWVPYGAIIATLFAPVPVRATIWTVALVWMGVACILNARRCGRTHCRYTGPYYLAMIAPVLLLAAGIGSAGFWGWLILGVLILAGSRGIWWATEHAWGKFSS